MQLTALRDNMIPKKYEPLLFGLILSGLMSFMVSGIATFRALGLIPGFFASWISAWLTAWLFAFPTVLLVTPVARRMVRLVIRKDEAA